ncbi:8-amino-7-oxononanoate synthase [Geothrix sp. PMB-07]|uniref:aminotransferase class I/II-fold pyridoxal phosphate-dependent enzyme n=1 Tax=Geothrix sp. PMB-07 TaxID=3068640 RepID=UPI0027419D99|nr:8-amino-7-oxononanoate synthase [Geothrix sp. PMB-07]WLT32198.1 8-amino-7-oxononanoate synthase [Geothrix sp. PMB-07]
MIPPPWQARLHLQAQHRQTLGRDRSIHPAAGVDVCSNDYLGLRRDPRLAEAAARAAHRHGAGAGAARLLRGTCELHEALEATLAQWKGQEACLLFNTGYQANAALIPALVGRGDAVFSDALNHASLVDGCRLARAGGAQVGIYRHLNLADLEAQLVAWRSASPLEALALVATDAVFSMDGDVADLPSLLALCERHGALLLVDEAHATGILGCDGTGLAQQQGVHGRIPLVMGTLGKALGAFGAFVCGDRLLREHLLNTARGFIFSTALPPPVLGAALEGIRIARAESWRRERALGLAHRLRQALGQPDQTSAIVPVPVGADIEAVRLAKALQELGYDVRAVRPPTVPEGSARLRITTGAHLTDAELDGLIAALHQLRANR